VRAKAKFLKADYIEAEHDLQAADQLDPDSGAYDLLKEYKEKADEVRKRQQAKKQREEQRSKKNVEEEPQEQENEGPNMNMGDMFNNPEILEALSNPRMQEILNEVMTNPAKIMEYMSDPEIGPLLSKIMSSFGAPQSEEEGVNAEDNIPASENIKQEAPNSQAYVDPEIDLD